MLTYQEYKTLVAEVNRMRNEVHLFNTEEIPEAALDDLKHKITLFETENPDLIDLNSPNYVVAGGIAEGFAKCKHERRMLSLNDIFTLQELLDWEKRWQDYAEKNGIKFEPKNNYICEPKIDGLALSLIYENGILQRAVTRGDGYEGEVVTENVKQIKTVPQTISDRRKLEVRGEVFMTKSDFKHLNNQILEGKKIGKMGKTGPDGVFANPRNVSSGTIRQLDSRIVGGRNLSFIAYNIFIFDSVESLF
jgi:DNA ligase (NAD+)